MLEYRSKLNKILESDYNLYENELSETKGRLSFAAVHFIKTWIMNGKALASICGDRLWPPLLWKLLPDVRATASWIWDVNNKYTSILLIPYRI